jgi:hypothetical protein
MAHEEGDMVDTDSGSLTTTFFNVINNVRDIIRFELRLAKTEVSEQAAKAKTAGILLGIGAAELLFAVLFALIAAMFALSTVMPNWGAALMIAGAMGLAGGILLFSGKKRLQDVQPVPQRTVESVKEDIQWAKQQAK